MVWGKALAHCGLVLLSLWLCVQSMPISNSRTKETGHDEEPVPTLTPESGLHYARYLSEVMDYLEKDPHFREKLKAVSIEDIKQGKLSKELDFVHHSVRTKLDELKRNEMNRLRMIVRAKIDAERSKDRKLDHQTVLKYAEYLNHANPDNFEVEDLDRLFQTTMENIQNYDKEHHEEFKRYEMMKEHERREKLKNMNEDDRNKAEQQYDEMKKKRADHPKVNHPGSEDQLKEVWEKEDGLDPQDFNPKTFFKLHDTNGDGYLDGSEIEALLTKELEKVYKTENEEDMVKMEEERLRMREHIIKEMDTNKDGLLSLSEFITATKEKEFSENEEWETIENKPTYTEEELKEFERKLAEHASNINEKSTELQKQREELERKQEALNGQQKEIQKALEEMEKLRAQSKNDQVKREDEPASVVEGNKQPMPSSHQQQDVPVPGHS